MNVLGILPGTDSVLRNEYVVVTAHMDAAADSGARHLGNGASDNASGVAGLLALAKAFGPRGARPKRSLLFAATTGTRYGAAGANALAEQGLLGRDISTPLGISLEALGGAEPKDSLLVDGMRDLDIVPSPAWVAAQHPELGLTLADGDPIAAADGDAVAFVGRALPALLFHGQRHDEPADAEAVDAEQAARRLRMIYYSRATSLTRRAGPTGPPKAARDAWPCSGDERGRDRLLLLEHSGYHDRTEIAP